MSEQSQNFHPKRNALLTQELTRRQLLVKAAAGGGLMLGIALPDFNKGQAHAASTATTVAGWITVGTDDTITVLVPITEMGQGTSTGLATIVADQLMVAWSKVKVEHAPVDAAHGASNANAYGFRFTGGSLGMRITAQMLQQTAANARQMLINAAANLMGTTASGCTLKLDADSITRIYKTSGGQAYSYGQVVASVGAAIPTATGSLISPDQTRYAGAAVSPPRLDIPAKIKGEAKFGIDIFEAGMLFAAVKHCPTSGGTVSTVGTKPSGTVALVKVGGSAANKGVAVVAATTWDAMQAVKALSVNWTLPADVSSRDTNYINTRAATLMASGAAITAQNTGDVSSALATPTINSTYQVPYLAHAALEPLSCSVRFKPAASGLPASCEIWAPTQAPDLVLQTAQKMCPTGTVLKIVNTLLGGGFGRKFELDFVIEAIQVGMACPGKLVKLTWPREQDFGNDQFRPMALSRITASASGGKITAWSNRIVTPSIAYQRGGTGLDGEAVHGAISRAGADDAGLPYAVPNSLVQWVPHDAPVPVGYWRSVGMSFNTFAVESAIDELAAASNMDPFDFRMSNLAETRLGPVLTALRSLSAWNTAPAAGRARGVAIAAGFGSFIGQVAEISVNTTTGAVTVHRVSTVLDCGTAIHRDAIKAQIEGAVAQAMSATLWMQQTFVNGVPQVTNYNRYRPVKLQDMPQIDLQIMDGAGLGGVGEIGIPCVAPAIANAYARLVANGLLVGGVAATRKRTLPFFPGTTLGGL
ncbi:MAG: molybdopterin cofactor-binding domain-containing protein [Limnohabitans sp.]